MSEENEILEIYKAYGYPSAQKLAKILADNGVPTKLKIVQDIIAKNTQYQLFKKTKKIVGAHMVSFRPNQIWQADLLDLQKFHNQNHGFRYILIVVDVFTRFAYAVPLKNKEATTVFEAFKKVTNEADSFPEKLITDNGNEFLNRQLTPYLKRNGIVHETNDAGYHPTLGIIDRFSRTIKEKLFKSFSADNNVIWDTKLKGFIEAYNKTPHRSLGDIAPNSVDKNFQLVYNINIQKNHIKNNDRFKVGQYVRKRLAKPLFTKGYKQIYSNTVYTIVKVQGVNALLSDDSTVKLNDLTIVSAPVESQPNKELQHVEIESRIDRRINKEGIKRDDKSIRRNLRERKVNQLEDVRYGKIVY